MNKSTGRYLENLAEKLAAQINEAQQELIGIQAQLREPEYASVVYVRSGDQTNLLKRSTFAYINGVGDSLQVGDRVIAPTRYNPYATGIVVALSRIQDDGYEGPFNTIKEVIYP